MRDQQLGIELALGNQLERFFAVAAVNPAGLVGAAVDEAFLAEEALAAKAGNVFSGICADTPL